jgi:hypothetical protein
MMAVEGVVSSREVASNETNGDPHQIQSKPNFTDHFRLTVEEMETSREEKTGLERE